MVIFDSNNHSAFVLNYHLIMCTKCRQKIIDSDISKRLKEIFLYIIPKYNITLEKWDYDIDYIHIIIKGQPNTEISKFINAYKSASSRLIKKEFFHVKESLCEEAFWSSSYCLLTTGEATIEIIKQYIETQGGDGGEKRKFSNKIQDLSDQKTGQPN